ncbi:glycoside hydrolase family 2 TIM barrel-domain containing protein [Flavobacterium sp.]|uniref:glycoside hydrolase family 2 TIM barrel-domain containing protein n=1 Tax=Flavobacterium sp. TaxID=239 RepID=UPI0040340923
MKKTLLAIIIAAQFIACHKPASATRTKKDFGSNWQFMRDNDPATATSVNLPHTPRIEKLIPINQWQGDCVYTKTFDVSPSADEKLFLYFEGVMHESIIVVNGQQLAHHKGGYTPFTVDITSVAKVGSNVVEVKVNNEDNPMIPPGKTIKTLDFNYFGGIYRNAYLIRTNKLYITDAVNAQIAGGGGLFIKFNDITPESAEGTLTINVQNDFDIAKTFSIKAILTDAAGKKHEFTNPGTTMQPGTYGTGLIELKIDKPLLWSVTDPNLYTLEVQLFSGKKLVDSYTTKTGIRKIEITDKGFFLNGKKMFINGTNRHQEYPYVGYAISDEAQYRDAVRIKNAGFDMVRLSHYPQSEAFMNACDELGVLVMNCISGWQFFGNEEFVKNSHQEIRDLARRDRNHPSVFAWEVSLNESEMSEEYMKKANEILRAELPHKGIYTAGWMDNANYDLFIPARQHGKAPDYWNNYTKGDRKIFIAEYGDWEYYAQNAGLNQTAFANLKEEERTSRQLRSAGEKRLLQQAFNFMEAFNSNLKGKDKSTIGQANWLMFDYNRGYSPDIESSGISDIFRIPKFAYYFYQSQRSPKEKLAPELVSGPMVHIATYWDAKSPTDVTVYSNCDEVALYLNDVLIAKQKPTRNTFTDQLQHPPFVFSLGKFTPGTLRAEGFIEGKPVSEHKVSTPGAPARLQVSLDHSGKSINASKPDVVFVYAKITDDKGTLVHDSNLAVTFEVIAENAEIIGGNTVTAEEGIATIVLRTEKAEGAVLIKASTPGLTPTTYKIK